ncbi:MAG: adenosylhomocysteinase [Candidatus Marinimicrobia bacterium]|nr:adenosylhomocysteinase [Candidatus Neomarinimicrobiota bacterium]MDD5582700.1 adenosylhomocysteinase [Candidatus Neomarinimicrobiota bacterium]
MKYCIHDITLAETGQQKIDWVGKWMKVVNRLVQKFDKEKIFQEKRVAMCIHLEAKTAYLAEVIQKLGAEVWITSSNSLSTKDDVCAALAKKGIHVFAKHGASEKEYWSYIDAITASKPHAVVDDGGDMCRYLHEHPDYTTHLCGICEETTTGVSRAKHLAATGSLKYPSLGINDALSKYLFDNRYGTGQSTWTAFAHLTNMSISGKCVVVAGYGWCGRGVATIAAGMGADVIVTEIDPWKALEAKMEGCRVMPMRDAAKEGDIFITTTGEKNILRPEHFKRMKNGAFLANAGHFNYEIDVEGLKKMAGNPVKVHDDIEEFPLEANRSIYLLAQGGIINIAGGLGHPVEILDLSFGLQLASLHYVLSHPNLKPGYYPVPREIDELVVKERLLADGVSIDHAN